MAKAKALQHPAAPKLIGQIDLFAPTRKGTQQKHKPRKPKLTFEQRYWSKVQKAGPDDCWQFIGTIDTCSLGYGRIRRDGTPLYAHRVAYELAHGLVPARAYVRHTCDNPACCNPAHLIAGIPADNVADMMAKGRQRRTLTKDEVREIDRLDREEGAYWTHARLARRFKVTETSIRRLLQGATWSKLTGRMTGPARKRAMAKAVKGSTAEARVAA